jgi:DNA-binding response OmpR family regulator
MALDRSSRAKILVVDDDTSMRNFLKLHLEKAGYVVLLAEDGKAGGELVLSASPNVILVNMDMPYWSGYGFFQRVKADAVTRNHPVVFLTADERVEERTLQLGAQACLRKPLRVDWLLKVVALLATDAA